MASLQLLERRMAVLEARLTELEGAYGESIYKLSRKAAKTDLGMRKLLSHFGLQDSTDAEVDAAMDEA